MAITNETPNTIHLAGPAVEVATKVAAAAITPGNLVEIDSSNQYKKHATSTGVAQPAFAIEHAANNNDVDDDYAASDQVLVKIGAPGSTFWAWLASGQSASIGSKLASNGAGLLTVSATNPVAFALEAKVAATVNDDGNGNCRIRVEVI